MTCGTLTATANTLWRKRVTYLGETGTGQSMTGWTFLARLRRQGETITLAVDAVDLANGIIDVGPTSAAAGPQAAGMWEMWIRWNNGATEDWWGPIAVDVEAEPT